MTSGSGANPSGTAAVVVGHCTESTGADGKSSPAPAAQEQELKRINFIHLQRAWPSRLAGHTCGRPRARPRPPTPRGSPAAVPARSLPTPGRELNRSFPLRFCLVCTELPSLVPPRQERCSSAATCAPPLPFSN